MDCNKRIAFSEPFSSHTRKVLSGFSLGVIASLLFITLLFLNSSFKFPKLQQLFLQRSQSDSTNSSWHYPFSTSNASITPLHTIQQKDESRIRELNVSKEGFQNTHLGDFELDRYNASFQTRFGNGNLTDPNGVAKVGNFLNGGSEIVAKNSSVSVNVEKTMEGETEKKSEKVGNFDYEKCNIFDGNWVRDDSKPYYPLGSCPFVDRDFDCHLNGRPDSDYVKWKWKPNGCDIPRYVCMYVCIHD